MNKIQDMSNAVSYPIARMSAQGNLCPIQIGLNAPCRGDWILCRTEFGLEIGQIVSETSHLDEFGGDENGIATFIRNATSEDKWLANQIRLLIDQAVEPCQKVLSQIGRAHV